MESCDKEEERQAMKTLKAEAKEMKESMRRLMIENSHWKMKDNKAQE